MLLRCVSFQAYFFLFLTSKQFYSGLSSATRQRFLQYTFHRMAESCTPSATVISLATTSTSSPAPATCTDTRIRSTSPNAFLTPTTSNVVSSPTTSDKSKDQDLTEDPSPTTGCHNPQDVTCSKDLSSVITPSDTHKLEESSQDGSSLAAEDSAIIVTQSVTSTGSVRDDTRKFDEEESVVKKKNELAEANQNPAKKSRAGLRIPPNAFVAVRIPSEGIKKSLGEVQHALVEYDRDMRHVLTSLEKLHLTFLVARLMDDSEIDSAKSTLDSVTRQVVEDYNLLTDPIELTFKGLGSFGRNVLFVKIEDGPSKERLLQIAEDVKAAFVSEKFLGLDLRPFKPHLTIAKMSKMPPRVMRRHKRRTGKRKGIESEGYSSFLGAEFGKEVLSGLELLSMEEPADSEGYYHCFKRNLFSDSV